MAKKHKKKVNKEGVQASKAPKRISQAPKWWANSSLHYLMIAVLAFGLYANTFTHDFCQDDAIVITDNMFTKQGAKGFSGIWNKDTFYGFFKKEGKDKLVAGGRYRPLTLLLFATEWQLFSHKDFEGTLTASPMGFHIVNVLLFVLLGLLLYKVTVTLLAYYKQSEAKLLAFFSTLIFVAHPVHTEVVANIKGADEIVALLGSLGALYLMIKAYRSGKLLQLVFALFLFGLAIFSKENVITFLAIIPAALFLFGQKHIGIAKEKVGRFAGYSVALLIAIFPFLIKRSSVLFGKSFQLMGPKSNSLELMNDPFLKYAGENLVPFSSGERVSTVFYTLGEYLRLLFAPLKLTHDYYPHHIEMMHFGDWQVILSILLYLGLIFIAVKSLRKNPMISFGVLVYLASLSIVSNFVFPVGVFMAERFLFMPSVGFSLAIGAVLVYFFRKGNKLVLGLLGVIILLFSVKTFTRNNAWKNDETLFLTDVKTSKKSAKVQNAAGGTLLSIAGKIKDPMAKKQKAKEALEHLKIAVKEHPRYANAWLLQGNAYNVLEQYDEAIRAYKNALGLKPNYPEAVNNLGITYNIAGKFYGEKKGNLQKAIPYLLEAVKLNENSAESNRLLGIAYAFSGEVGKSIPYLEKAFFLNPYADLALDISLAYSQAKNKEKADFYRRKAVALDPEAMKKRMNRKRK